ncbi:hypothetical protein Barb7_03113 [Bacteroidales bacterium Barb7]|nr:hypothetical protein Barb7_03113 [Bacteroidales bacterium Barb7]
MLTYVTQFVAGADAFKHGKRVKERLHGGADLPPPAVYHIILEKGIVNAADVGFHMSRLCVHRHEGGAKETFVVADGVPRSHHRVNHAPPTENAHLHRLLKLFLYIVFPHAALFEGAVAVGLAHGVEHDGINLSRRKVSGEGSIRASVLLVGECRLEEAADMFAHGFFGVLLHTGVDGGIDL